MKYEINMNYSFSTDKVVNFIKKSVLSFYMIKSGDYKMTEDSILVLNIDPENDIDRVLTEICMCWILEDTNLVHTEELQKCLENTKYITYVFYDILGESYIDLKILGSFIKEHPDVQKKTFNDLLVSIEKEFICEECGRSKKVFHYICHNMAKYISVFNKFSELNASDSLEELEVQIKNIDFDIPSSYKYNIETGKPRKFRSDALMTYVTGVYNYNGVYSLSDNYISSFMMDCKIKRDPSKIITIVNILATDLYLVTDEEYDLILKGIDRLVSIIPCEDKFDQQVLSEVRKYSKKTLVDEWNRKNK